MRRTRVTGADKAQNEVVAVAEAMGATVEDLRAVGKGCADLLIGYRGVDLLWEVKSGSKTRHPTRFERAHGGLNEAQDAWHRRWRGRMVEIIHNGEEARESLLRVNVELEQAAIYRRAWAREVQRASVAAS